MRQKQTSTKPILTAKSARDQSVSPVRSQGHSRLLSSPSNLRGTNEQDLFSQDSSSKVQAELSEITPRRLNIEVLVPKISRNPSDRLVIAQSQEDLIGDSDEEEKSVKNIKSLDAAGAKGFQKNYSENNFLCFPAQNYHNRIQLIVRIRPFLVTEQVKECLKVVNENGIRLFKDFHQMHFKFDNILQPKDSQDGVFAQVEGITQGFLMGINGTIFAYGQTGAGKTYSIMGVDAQNSQDLLVSEKKGVLPRTLDFVFSKLPHEREQNKSVTLMISFYEIYNDKLTDLLSQKTKPNVENPFKKRIRSLSQNSKTSKRLELREEKDGQFSIPELKKVQVNTKEEAYHYFYNGLIKRSTSSTSLNNQSSRSHSIFQIYMEKENSEGVVIRSKIRIVDLAGSEKYAIKKDLPQQEKSIRVQELTSINSSLSALGQCISALSDPSRKHIPYRNSKLTKILKDSLDESSKVALIICISPSIDSYKETLSTLQFADRAKKAILDGRNFSDSKLIHDNMMQNNQNSMGNLMKAYQEEKAIRKGLETYMKESNVYEQLDKLKKQNKELQDKVKMLELDKAISGASLKERESPVSFNEQEQDQREVLQESMPQILTTIKRTLKSCFKQSKVMVVNDSQDRINIIQLGKISQSPIEEEDEEKQKKTVKFAEKLDNDQSLDSDDRERIEHNLKYNDDTIFDNISIFRDVNNSGIVIHQRLQDKKDVHPSKLKNKPVIEDDDDEDEEEEVKEIPMHAHTQEHRTEKEMSFSDPAPSQPPLTNLISQISDQTLKEFWGISQNQNSQQQPQMKMDISIIKPAPANDSGVSPIQNKKPNNSSQDMSKDLIDLENDQMLDKRLGELNQSNLSEIRIGERSLGSTVRKLVQQTSAGQNEVNNSDPINKESFIFDPPQKQSEPIFEDNMEDGQSFFQQEEADFGVAENEAKNYQVCDTTEQFFEGDFYEKDAPQSQRDEILVCGEDNQILQDSMMGLEAAIDVKNIVNNYNQNNSQDNQNTLLLDSQSMIIENENQRDLNMSQQLNLIESSSILQQRDTNLGGQQNNVLHPGNTGPFSNQRFFSINQAFNLMSGTTTQTHNTDVLTYSLTNTFTTIESIHDELANIKTGLEQSQKNGNNIMKTIQKYAREIEENKVSDFYPYQEEDVKSNEDILEDQERMVELSITQGEDNLNFIKDIKGFYSKIHQEINNLKCILIDSSKNPHGQVDSPSKRQNLSGMMNRKTIDREVTHLNSDEKYHNPVLASQVSLVSIESIEKTQDIIFELRKEIEFILDQGQQASLKVKNRERNQDRKSFRVLELLEVLQNSLMQSITPLKEKMSNTKDERRLTEIDTSNIKKSNNLEDSPELQTVVTFSLDSHHPQRNNFLQESLSPVQKKQVYRDHTNNPANQRQLNQYEETSGDLLSSPRPIQTKQRSSSDKNKNSGSSQGKQKRTPEIFKSLAKLEESEAANSFIDRDFNVNNSQLRSNNFLITGISGAGGLPIHSLQNQQRANNQSREMSDHPDFQITLRSSSVKNQENEFQIPRGSIPSLQHQQSNPGADFKQLRKSAIGHGQIVGTDNTLTLIFDSDEEEEVQRAQQLSDEEDGLPKVKEVVDDQVSIHITLEGCYRLQEGSGEAPNLGNGNHSLIFNDDSKIERSSSLGGGCNNSRLANNLITSSSFQADNSLLFFANNIIINNNSNTNHNQNIFGAAADINTSMGMNLLTKIPSQCSNNSFSKDESNVVRGTTPERVIKDLKTQNFGKKKKNKYLLPQQKRQDSNPIPLSQDSKLLQPAANSGSDQPSGVSFSQVEDEHVQKQQVRTSEMVGNKFTSKNSVHKYWNQFFNQPQIQSKFSGQKQGHQPQNSMNGAQLVALIPQEIPRDNNTRNTPQQISRSAYQSSSYDLN